MQSKQQLDGVTVASTVDHRYNLFQYGLVTNNIANSHFLSQFALHPSWGLRKGIPEIIYENLLLILGQEKASLSYSPFIVLFPIQ